MSKTDNTVGPTLSSSMNIIINNVEVRWTLNNLHGPGSFRRIIEARFMYIHNAYTQNEIDTGIKKIPYN